MTELTSTAATLVTALAEKFSEPEWLRQLRNVAWENFVAMPSPRLEKTDLTKRTWDVGPFAEAPAGAASESATTLLQSISGVPLIYVRDGVVVDVMLPPELASQGVIFTDLHTAVQKHTELVKKHLGSVVKADESKWAALNTAAWCGGAFLFVPRNVHVAAPFHFIYEQTEHAQGALPRVLVVGEESSVFSFTEVLLSCEGASKSKVHSHVLEAVAMANAQLTVSSVNEYKKGPTNCSTRRALLHKDAQVDWMFGDVGDGFTVAVVESDLQGPGSRSSTQAFGIGSGRQHLDLTASMLHSGRNSTSDIVMHGVLREKANSIYRSSTHIFKNAVSAGSEQRDRMIIMDGTARADAIPMLLIDENDVQRCGHAASVGRIDQNQIYYLMSRGIPRVTATKLVIWGHLQPTVGCIPSEGVRAYISGLIDRELA
jgi:Fe-S cluster assembly protein SufD